MQSIKQECVKRMEGYGLDKGMVIAPFLKGDNVMISEYMNSTYKAVLYSLDDYAMAPGLKEAVEEFEKEYNAVVYHIIGTPLQFESRLGDYTYCLMYVNKDDSEWFVDRKDVAKMQCMAYVIGVDDEIGYIGVEKAMGGLYRKW